MSRGSAARCTRDFEGGVRSRREIGWKVVEEEGGGGKRAEKRKDAGRERERGRGWDEKHERSEREWEGAGVYSEVGWFGGWLAVGGFRGWWRHPVYPD